jgi:hypothetical protein
VRKVGIYMRAFDVLQDEKNWAVREDEVVWVGEGDPLEIMKKAEREAA